jgi:hypothetical protein
MFFADFEGARFAGTYGVSSCCGFTADVVCACVGLVSGVSSSFFALDIDRYLLVV